MRSLLEPRCGSRVPPSNFGSGWMFSFSRGCMSRLGLLSSLQFFSRWAHKHILGMRITAGPLIFVGAFAALASWCLMDVEENACAEVVKRLCQSDPWAQPKMPSSLIQGCWVFIVVLIRHRCGHPNSRKSSEQSWQQTPPEREGVGLTCWGGAPF